MPSTIRKLPSPAPVDLLVRAPVEPGRVPKQPELEEAPAPRPPEILPSPAQRPVVAPLSPERYRVQFTIPKETHDKLRHIQDLLCREVPDGDPAAIFDRALDALSREVEKKKMAAATKPRPPRGARDGSRHIPADVRRAVWKRDAGRCAFVGKSARCTERRYLELHHVQPFGHQGPATVENISLRCRAHNVFESELVFGRFCPPVVRETPANYATSQEIAPFQNGARLDSPRYLRASRGSSRRLG